MTRRQRAVQDGYSHYVLDLKSGKTSGNHASFSVVNKDNGHGFVLEVHGYDDGTFRVLMNEKEPLYPRYQVEHALLPDLTKAT
jgi:hypothetical protein